MPAAAASKASSPLRPIERRVVLLVFAALLLDLLAFTIPLPLFPRIVSWYSSRSPPTSLLARTLATLRSARSSVLHASLAAPARSAWQAEADQRRWDVVLLGGFLGSVFSFCQFLVSPAIGTLADAHGRRRVLLATMAGNVLSTVIWLQSTSFTSFLLARLVGGLSEGNVQLSILVLSDVTTPSSRPRALALVGLAFSLAFTLGPLLGAWFASRPLPSTPLLGSVELNVYAFPALIALGLLLAETAFLALSLPETRGWHARAAAGETKAGEGASKAVVRPLEERKKALKELKRAHRAFLFFFSGAEFTLTFLTYDLFAFSNAQSGKLLAFIGVLSALLQGGYTRRPAVASTPLRLSQHGAWATSLGLGLLACLPAFARGGSGAGGPAGPVLYAGAACLAFASATVVNGLNAGASLLCSDSEASDGDGAGAGGQGDGQGGELRKGRTMGEFRSAGQLGRALGPLFACSSYWLLGPAACYALNALALALVAASMGSVVGRERALAAGAGADAGAGGASSVLTAAAGEGEGEGKKRV